MKAYIINLERSTDRKEYMKNQLEKLPFLSVEFVKAVDGREMSSIERHEKFDEERFLKRYAKEVRLGEIGCTLSHQKCYQRLVDSEENCAFIVEDDAALDGEVVRIFERIEKVIDTQQPQIILLSGWFWYYKSKSFYQKYRLANVYDGFLTHAYVINRSAASLLLDSRPYITADDWQYIRRKGVRLRGLLPHLFDQQQDNLQSLIQPIEGPKLCKGMLLSKIRIYRHVISLRLLKSIGRFEGPVNEERMRKQ